MGGNRARRTILRFGVLLALLCAAVSPGLGGTAEASSACPTASGLTTCTFHYTGAEQTWTVPAGVTQVTLDVYGAQGGYEVSAGGQGGRATATIDVTPGETLTIVVGGQGGSPFSGGDPHGGFNGGGNGGAFYDHDHPFAIFYGSGGGGASDVRIGGTDLAHRVVVAGGGGGAADESGPDGDASGGAGGGLTGGTGGSADISAASGGAGGNQDGTTGSGLLGVGSNGADNTSIDVFNGAGAGGGGGGYYGGAGGSPGTGGGGGSGFGPAGTVFKTGVRSGNGLVQLTYTKIDQTISFDLSGLPAKTYGDGPFDISSYASATSGLPVSFSSATPIVCVVSGSTVTLMAPGTCTINADQAGNDSYSAAPQVQQSFSVAKVDQSITVETNAPNSAAYNSSFTVAATADSGLAVTYGSSGACSNSGATFTMISGTGSCTVTFSQDGNDYYNAATLVTETVTATKLDQAITFMSAAPTNALYGDTYSPSASGGDSGNPIIFGASGACSYDAGTGVVTMTNVGTCTITADQAGNDDYNAAPQVTQSFSVGVTFDILSKLTAQFETSPFINDLLQFDLRCQEFGRNRGILGNFCVNLYIATVNAQRGRTLTDRQADTLIQLAQVLWPSASQTGSSGTFPYSGS